MIILQEELAQEFRKEVLESFCLLDINFPVPVYLTETDNQVIHDEKIYVSRGFSFDNINSAPGLSVAEIDLLIDNTDQVFSSILMNGDQRGREVKISLGAAIGGPGAVADGSVKTATRANTKISAVDGSAFVDFSESAYLTLPEHRGCKLTLTDSTGKKLVGYIKAAGTGETYGSELITNGTFNADIAGWNAYHCDADSIAGGFSGNCARVTENGETSPSLRQTIGGLHTGKLIKWNTLQVKAGTHDRYRAYLVATQVVGWAGTHIATNEWTNKPDGMTFTSQFSSDGTPQSTATLVLMLYTTVGTGLTFLFDECSMTQILTPSTTGVTITSTADGTTYNWASKEAGFNYNDASGYTYKLERERSLLVQEFIRGFISSWELSSDNQVRISVKNEAMLWAKKTLRIHSSSCPWVFKGTECGYSGTATWCDRNYARCGELLNTDNYGGFRFLPSIMEREIWWGRQRK